MSTEPKQPYYNARAATKLALGAGLAAGLVIYVVNGGDLVRSAIGGAIWVAIGWYSGKVLFPCEAPLTPKSGE